MADKIYLLTASVNHGDAWTVRAYHSEERAKEDKEALERYFEKRRYNREESDAPDWWVDESWRRGDRWEIRETTLDEA